mmetsp:Transcript_102812/g.165633  ORF Transcript_102812/g.165633 Transcript_102812/m.165633 type:complete len:120 (+) Transcript_102812:292-651(+)
MFFHFSKESYKNLAFRPKKTICGAHPWLPGSRLSKRDAQRAVADQGHLLPATHCNTLKQYPSLPVLTILCARDVQHADTEQRCRHAYTACPLREELLSVSLEFGIAFEERAIRLHVLIF